METTPEQLESLRAVSEQVRTAYARLREAEKGETSPARPARRPILSILRRPAYPSSPC